VVVDVARDASGRWLHPARLHHARPDVPSLTSPRGVEWPVDVALALRSAYKAGQ
jgi:hypothetical protein